MTKSVFGFFGALTFALCAVSCSSENGHGNSDTAPASPPKVVEPIPDDPLDRQLQRIIAEAGLTGNPMIGRDIPDIDSSKAQLGKKLFYAKSLSGSQDTACASCHHPLLGGGDNLSLPIGIGSLNPDVIGLDRQLDKSLLDEVSVPRNAPTIFNIAGWDEVIFHDGRIESIDKQPKLNGAGPQGIKTPDTQESLVTSNLVHEQARFPITATFEMKGLNYPNLDRQNIRDHLAGRLGGYSSGKDEITSSSYWVEQFKEAYGKEREDLGIEYLINELTITEAIADYERSMVLVDNPWSRYVSGDKTALTAAQKRGAVWFFTPSSQGGGNCASCHSGDFFTDESFHNIVIPQIGEGKDRTGQSRADLGRYNVTAQEQDKFKFRTPSLLNVEVTGPWAHNGAFTSLEQMIKQHMRPRQTLSTYDPKLALKQGDIHVDNWQQETQKALQAYDKERANHNVNLVNPNLTDRQVFELVSFLKALTDPCTKSRACMAKWMLDTTDPALMSDEFLHSQFDH